MSAVETSPSTSASTNLRDFLRLKDEDIGVRRGRLPGNNLAVDSMSTMEKLRDSPSSHTSRTLLDITLGEEVNTSSSSSSDGSNNVNWYSGKDKKSWRFFKEKIRTQIIRSGNPNCESSTGPSQFNLPSNFSSAESVQEMPAAIGRVMVRGEDDRGAGGRGPASGQRSSTPLGSLVPISIELDHQPDGVARSELTRSTREVTGSGAMSNRTSSRARALLVSRASRGKADVITGRALACHRRGRGRPVIEDVPDGLARGDRSANGFRVQ